MMAKMMEGMTIDPPTKMAFLRAFDVCVSHHLGYAADGNVLVEHQDSECMAAQLSFALYLSLFKNLLSKYSLFDMQNKPWPSFLDGVGNGLGYAYILVVVGGVRELLGRGSLLGFQLIPQGVYDAGYINNGMMTMPAMALILLGCVIWIHRAYFYKEK